MADLANGSRQETYVMEGQRGSGTICVNGASARLVDVGDLVIIMAFAYVTPAEAPGVTPNVVLVNEENRVVKKL